MPTADPAVMVNSIFDRPVAFDITVADGTAIAKGDVLQLTDPRTGSSNTTVGGVLAGIALRDKVANDGRTRLAVCPFGIFEMRASGGVTVGQPVTAYLNDVQVAAVTASGAQILGHALETASDNEIVNVFVHIGMGGAGVA